MTQQHAKQSINSNPTSSRSVDQVDIDASLTTPAVVLTSDDEFVVLNNGGPGTYIVNLPDVRTTPGREVTLMGNGGFSVTVATVEIDGVPSGQTIGGAATQSLALGESMILRASPAGTDAAPATNWFIMGLEGA